MPFQNYIVLRYNNTDYRYKTLAKAWRPQIQRPLSVKMDLSGNLNATAAAAYYLRWEGTVIAPVTPGPVEVPLPDWGSVTTLRGTLKAQWGTLFKDHYGTTYNPVYLMGPFYEQSLLNVWDAPNNKIYFTIQIIARGL
jgi:hypothetical protein